MRVVLVTEFYYPHPGGITEHVHHLGLSLVRRGHQVLVVTSHVAEAPRRPARETVAGLDIVRLGVGLPVESNGSQSRVTIGLNLERKMRELVAGADLVHVHSPLFPMLPYLALKAARRAGIPTVGTFHTHFAGSKAMAAFRGLIRKYAGALDCCIAVSESARRSVAPYVKNPFLIIPNGVDVAAWRSGQPRPELAGRRNIVFLGRLDPRNDVELLIQAFVLASAQRDELQLVLVGDGTRRPQCEAAVPSALRERVVFAGLQMELLARANYLAAAAVVAFTARICSHPQTLIEAMAAGRPVVAYDIEGVRELVHDGREGYLVPVGDVPALAAALLRVVGAAPDAQRALGEHSFAQAQGFDWPRIAERIEHVYQCLRSGQPLPAPERDAEASAPS